MSSNEATQSADTTVAPAIKLDQVVDLPFGRWEIDPALVLRMQEEMQVVPETPGTKYGSNRTDLFLEPNGDLAHLRLSAIDATLGVGFQSFGDIIVFPQGITNPSRTNPRTNDVVHYSTWSDAVAFPFFETSSGAFADGLKAASLHAAIRMWEFLAHVPPLAGRATTLTELGRRVCESEDFTRPGDLSAKNVSRLFSSLSTEAERSVIPELNGGPFYYQQLLVDQSRAIAEACAALGDSPSLLRTALSYAVEPSPAGLLVWLNCTDFTQEERDEVAVWFETIGLAALARLIPPATRDGANDVALSSKLLVSIADHDYALARKILNAWSAFDNVHHFLKFRLKLEYAPYLAAKSLKQFREEQAEISARPASVDLSEFMKALDIPEAPLVHEPTDVANPNDPMQKLTRLSGLDGAKDEIRRIAAEATIAKQRQQAGMPAADRSRHFVFAGNPGTAKTTVARIVGEIFAHLGVLEHGRVVEVSRADLVAPFVGQTAPLVTKVVKDALGGVLFIDEAYLLAQDGDTFGAEAVGTLMKLMEDHRNELTVIMAGYTEEMLEFVNRNPGFKSRISATISFDDYGIDQLMEIADFIVEEKACEFTPRARAAVRDALLTESRKSNFANGRAVRTLIESTLANQAVRLSNLKDIANADQLRILEAHDVPGFQEPQEFIESNAINELDSLTGLESVKGEVRKLIAAAKVNAERRKQNLSVVSLNQHLVFSGNPGTAKTTVARVIARIYKDLGILQSGHLVETSRSELVGEFVGQTAPKVTKVVERAIGGVLFIDEAYLLTPKSPNDFGAEAIGTLLKLMEDHREELVVIVAGYRTDMTEFLATNAGLESRFATTIDFPDYNLDELMQIMKFTADKYEYELDPAAVNKMCAILDVMRERPGFSNGRAVRSMLERAIAVQSERVSVLENADNYQLSTILAVDVIEEPNDDDGAKKVKRGKGGNYL